MALFKKSIVLITIVLTFNILLHPVDSVKSSVTPDNNQELEIERLKRELSKLRNRLNRIEPEKPKQIIEKRFDGLKYPTSTASIDKVLKTGNEISFTTRINKPDYIRPIYEKEWHSTVGRWSYIPNRIRYAYHRLFTEYDIGLSNWYDFEHDLGLEIPMFQNQSLDLYIVTFQTEVLSIYTLGNQVVIVGEPTRTGVQVNTIKTSEINPIHKNEFLLVQLVTPDGYEIDHTLISYIDSDYWKKIKER